MATRRPTPRAITLGSTLSAATAASTQLQVSSLAHAAIVFALALAGALLIHPTKTMLAGEPIPTPLPTDGAHRTPTSPV